MKQFIYIFVFVLQFFTISYALSQTNNKLIRAAHLGDHQQVLDLLEAGQDPNQTDAEGRTALTEASFQGHIDIVEILVRYGANVDLGGIKLYSPLSASILGSHFHITRFLIEEGPDLRIPDINGMTPLHHAVRHGDHRTLLLLLESGAPVDSLCIRHDTPLHMAAGRGQTELAISLLAHGAKTHLKNKYGFTAAESATLGGYPLIAELIETHN